MKWWGWLLVTVFVGWCLAALLGVVLLVVVGSAWRTAWTPVSASPGTTPAPGAQVPPVTPVHHLQPGETYVRIESRPGLVTHRRDRWVTPRVAAALERAAEVAAAAGGALQVGQASREGGGPFPPHLSHRDGRDVDIGYDGSGYPSPPGATPPAWWVAALLAAGPREVFVRADLVDYLRAQGVNARHWPGHARHAHWRFA